MIYFDNAATTKPCKPAVDAFLECAEDFGNPSARHGLGLLAERRVTSARAKLSGFLGCHADKIYFTSGATEANNLVILGTQRDRKLHYITTAAEHPSVLETFRALERMGHELTVLGVNESGFVDIDRLAHEIRDNTALVSVIHVNNETGVIQDISAIGQTIKERNAKTLFHVDSVQGFLKFPLNLDEARVDFLTASAHKLHGFKGTGLLYARNKDFLRPTVFGGHQQSGVRAGTENVGGIVAFAAAAEWFANAPKEVIKHIKAVMAKLERDLPDCYINGDSASPFIINLSFVGTRAETVLNALSEQEVYVSAGAACSSHDKTAAGLTYLGIGRARAESALRFSFSVENNTAEALIVSAKLMATVPILRRTRR